MKLRTDVHIKIYLYIYIVKRCTFIIFYYVQRPILYVRTEGRILLISYIQIIMLT